MSYSAPSFAKFVLCIFTFSDLWRRFPLKTAGESFLTPDGEGSLSFLALVGPSTFLAASFLIPSVFW
jgi:hypothetical protein